MLWKGVPAVHNRGKLFLFKIVLVLADLALFNAGYILVFYLRYGWPVPIYNFAPYLATWPWLSATALALMYFYRLYSGYRWRWAETFAGILCAVFFQALAAVAIAFYLRGFSFPRMVLLMVPFAHLVLLAAWRRLAWNIERGLQGTREVLVAGSPAEAEALADKLEAVSFGMIRVAGLVAGEASGGEPGNISLVRESNDTGQVLYAPAHRPVLGKISAFCECLDAVHPDWVFICAGLSAQDKAEVLYACAARDVRAYLVPDFYEILVAQSRLEQVDDIPVFAVGRLSIPEESRLVKRAFDVVFSAAGLLLAAPLMLVVALVVRLDSPGPVFYRQWRLTEHGTPFYLYKFRTMVDGAEAGTGPVLAGVDDPRVTRAGRFLRAARLDELPQMYNVLRGDMSLVGPRPERPYFVNQLMSEVPEYVYRMNVKSGITGLAQVAGRYSTSPECKLMYDLLYTRTYSPARDFAILLQTLKVMLMKDRAL
jgi:exopolysaccharide biosynthesis polyprenyl glycosylphosphotransferase